MFIYKITNTTNGDFYIGKTTKTLTERLSRHHYNTRYGAETHLSRAIRKYGAENFIIESLESQVPESKLNEREIYWISKLNPQYNMTPGGDGGCPNRSQNWIESNRRHHQNRKPESYATYGMKGKKQSQKFMDAIKKSNSNPVVCEGVEYPSIKAAEEYYRSIGKPKSVRKRIDSPKHTDWYRLRPATKRK